MAAGGLTLKQEKLAKVIASGKASSITEAAELAGMARPTASKLLSRNVTLQREVSRLVDSRADKATRIAGKAASVVERELDREDCRPEVAVVAWKAATEIAREEPPSTEALTGNELDLARTLMLHAVALGARIGARLGKDRAAALLGQRLEALGPPSTDALKVLGLRRLRDLLDYAAGVKQL